MVNAVPQRLRSILEYKQTEVAQLRQRTTLSELEARARETSPPRPFERAITAIAKNGGNALICEVKRKSPSAGQINDASAPESIAQAYEKGGAACISVLTDGPSFGGSLADLLAVREAVSLPLLRKDFMVDPLQVYEARAGGADAILIIMAAVSDELATELHDAAQRLDLAVLVESHTAGELDRALKLPSPLIGVNNRDLHTFVTELAITESVANNVPDDRVLISESGIRSAADVAQLRAAGARGFLVGESAMRAPEPAAFVRSLVEQR